MKWKDSGGTNEQSGKSKEEYFDEEQYSPWSNRKGPSNLIRLDRSSLIFVLLGLAIVASAAALLTILLGNHNDTSNNGAVAALQQRVDQLQERLDKYDGIDQKVTQIWGQAKSFEKFKDRFDRDEASTSLQLDHLTMSLEKLQKQFNDFGTGHPSLSASRQPARAAGAQEPSAVKYHTVVAGDTLYSISKHYNIAVGNLLKLNGLKTGSILEIGQRLRVSGPQ